jgi:hypothetical protein
MAIARIQHAEAKTTASATVPITITASLAGSLLVVMIANDISTLISGVTDNNGNTYVQAPGAHGGDAFARQDIWYSANAIAGVTTITVTANGTSAFLYGNMIEYSGVKTTSPLDTANQTVGTSPPVGPSLVVSTAGSVAITYCFPHSVALTSVSSPWTLVAIDSGDDAVAEYINPPISTISASFIPATAQTFQSTGAVFLPPASGPSNAVKTGMFLVF